MNHQERLECQRLRRRANQDADTKKYEKTKKGKLMRTYRNMQSRTRGLVKPHLYSGLPILEREVFYEWALASPEYSRLYEDWLKADYDRKLSPSIDRINTSGGYLIGNIRWITHSENSSLGAKGRKKVE